MAYTNSQIERIGNLLVYITSKLGAVPKTKLLKLIYIIEEESVKKSGTQFTDLTYTYLPLGPVSTFVNTQIDKKREPIINYVTIEEKGKATLISPKREFLDDEFSNFDLELIDTVLKKFGHLSGEALIKYTHREGSPWKKLHDDYEGKVPAKARDLDLNTLLDNADSNKKIKEAVAEEIAFLKYLRD